MGLSGCQPSVLLHPPNITQRPHNLENSPEKSRLYLSGVFLLICRICWMHDGSCSILLLIRSLYRMLLWQQTRSCSFLAWGARFSSCFCAWWQQWWGNYSAKTTVKGRWNFFHQCACPTIGRCWSAAWIPLPVWLATAATTAMDNINYLFTLISSCELSKWGEKEGGLYFIKLYICN